MVINKTASNNYEDILQPGEKIAMIYFFTWQGACKFPMTYFAASNM